MCCQNGRCSASYFDDIFIAQCLRFFDDDIVGFSPMVAILDIAVVHVYTLDLKYHKKLTDIKKEICQFLSHASIFQDKRADFPAISNNEQTHSIFQVCILREKERSHR